MADFFDKIKQGISNGVATATVKSTEMLEVTRLKSQINTIREQKRNAIEELGNIVYTMFLKGGIDEARIKDRGGAIKKIDGQIAELDNEIHQVQKKARESLGVEASIGKCTCGAEFFENTKFCGGCGKKIENNPIAAIPADVSSSNACGQCNATMVSGSKFCNACGAKVC